VYLRFLVASSANVVKPEALIVCGARGRWFQVGTSINAQPVEHQQERQLYSSVVDTMYQVGVSFSQVAILIYV